MKAVSLLSGGIDSPVASYLMSRAGADVVLLHMDNSPYCDDRALKNVIAIAEQLEKHTGKRFPLYVAPHGPSQTAIHDACDRNYQCVMCKRAMHRTAGEFARIVGADMIVMGDSLGQVASQTLKNLRAERTDMTIPVVRPLIGLDKTEIMAIAREIGTFDISISPSVGCTIVPHKATTAADPERIESFKARIDVDSLAREAAGKAILVRRDGDAPPREA
ncbi:MAG: tRNA 4-thiouridine(8) synthase ThiI [Candidatus Methanomethylophilaceae archaeon]|nr:tRNA 4-thiouridine(8) synthase ThiI [Candidatus Methanomethylophilaceae archaeon]